MRSLVLSLLALLSMEAMSQDQGIISYEEKVNVHAKLKGNGIDLKNMVPKHKIKQYQLLFDASSSLYKPLPQDDIGQSSGGFSFRMGGAYSELWLNRTTREQVELKEFMGKDYLILDTLDIHPWKIGEEQREIMGYTCKAAYFTDTTSNREVTAWYTMDLPSFIGPGEYNTLPGTVLALDINGGERLVIAKDITLRELKKKELKKPAKGKKMTSAEYKTFMHEQLETMQENSGGRIIIRK